MRQVSLCLLSWMLLSPARAETFAEQNARLFKNLQTTHAYSDEQMAKVQSIFATSGFAGQGNPAVTKRPMTSDECRQRRKQAGVIDQNPEYEKICGAKYMSPLFDPSAEKMNDAKACIDQYEFPNIPCDYPVVWVKTKEAAEICEAVGKRLCDAHEWEGSCEGKLTEPDYRFDLAKGVAANTAVQRMRLAHNQKYAPSKSWSYGKDFAKGVCAQNSTKDNGCNGGDWKRCGSNHYPSGSFPACKSSLDVYDTNGNAAEHMNLPLSESQMASRGSKELGVTEMKGSWFIWDKFQAHEDWCRWRAPYWHGSRVMDKHSHENYHLGFRCCKSLK